MTVIALDLGGTKLASAAFSSAGDILYRTAVPLDGRGGEAVAALIAEQCLLAMERARGASAAAPDTVGVAVPGIYRAERGTVWAPNIPGWDDYPLLADLHRRLGATTRVVMDSDRAACILGATWRGAARGARHAIFLTVGTGIGAGIVVDGTLLRGHDDIAGAIGWWGLDRPFSARYASCGCFEHQASGPGLVKVARELMGADAGYDGELRTLGDRELTAERIFAAHGRGDAIATRVIDQAIELWAMAAANLVSIFNPETIVFGGGLFGPAAALLGRIQAEALRWGQPIAMRRVRFVPSALGTDAALYGAARLALQAREAAHGPRLVASMHEPPRLAR